MESAKTEKINKFFAFSHNTKNEKTEYDVEIGFSVFSHSTNNGKAVNHGISFLLIFDLPNRANKRKCGGGVSFSHTARQTEIGCFAQYEKRINGNGTCNLVFSFSRTARNRMDEKYTDPPGIRPGKFD